MRGAEAAPLRFACGLMFAKGRGASTCKADRSQPDDSRATERGRRIPPPPFGYSMRFSKGRGDFREFLRHLSCFRTDLPECLILHETDSEINPPTDRSTPADRSPRRRTTSAALVFAAGSIQRQAIGQCACSRRARRSPCRWHHWSADGKAADTRLRVQPRSPVNLRSTHRACRTGRSTAARPTPAPTATRSIGRRTPIEGARIAFVRGRHRRDGRDRTGCPWLPVHRQGMRLTASSAPHRDRSGAPCPASRTARRLLLQRRRALPDPALPPRATREEPRCTAAAPSPPPPPPPMLWPGSR